MFVGDTVRGNDGTGIALDDLTGARLPWSWVTEDGGGGNRLSHLDEFRSKQDLPLRSGGDGIEFVDATGNALGRNLTLHDGDGAIVVTGTSSGDTLSEIITD